MVIDSAVDFKRQMVGITIAELLSPSLRNKGGLDGMTAREFIELYYGDPESTSAYNFLMNRPRTALDL